MHLSTGSVGIVTTHGLSEHPGEWVAIDPSTDAVIDSAEALAPLLQRLADCRLQDTVIQRAPADGDPLFIAFG